jgi:sugar lactone lactonase YvrE
MLADAARYKRLVDKEPGVVNLQSVLWWRANSPRSSTVPVPKFRCNRRVVILPALALLLLMGTSGPARAEAATPNVSLFSIGATDAIGLLREVSSIAVAPDASVYVADRVQDRIQRFGTDGRVLDVWGAHGIAPGQLYGPEALAVGPDGSVYVADAGNHRVQRFDARGSFLMQWGNTEDGPGRLLGPEGVATAADGTVYVSDLGSNQIKRYTADGAYLGAFGRTGPPEDWLDYPRQIAVGPDGSLYVNDYANDRIQRYTPEGTRLGAFSVAFSNPSRPRGPSALTVGSDGTVYVAHDRLSIFQFTPDGRQSDEVGYYGEPVALAATGKGTMFVALKADSNYDRVSGIYRPSGRAIVEIDVPAFQTEAGLRQLGAWAAGDAPGQFGVRFGWWAQRFTPTVGPDGTLYVADPWARRIQRFQADGLYLGAWPAPGNGELGIAAAPDGTVWLADVANEQIVHLTADGAVLSARTHRIAGMGPSGLTVAPDGSIYAFQTEGSGIHHIAPSGQVLARLGAGLPGLDAFAGCVDFDVSVNCSNQPLAVAPDGDTVYAPDGGNHRVARFTPEGKFLGHWTGLAAESQVFDWPQGIATAPDGTVYVTDTPSDRVLRFATDGRLLDALGDPGRGAGALRRPIGLAWASNGTLFVAERDNLRIQAFGTRAADSWRGELFGNRWLAERPLAITQAADLDFDWGTAPPAPDVPASGFTARFDRTFRLAAGRHSFALDAHGGVRLWAGNLLLVDAWHAASVDRNGTFDVASDGPVALRLEFQHTVDAAALHLTLGGSVLPTQTPEPSPTVTPTRPPTATQLPTATPGPGQVVFLPWTGRPRTR